MLESLTADSVYASIIMQEPEPRAVLLVEGADDDMMLGEHLAPGVLGIVCGSRGVVVGAVEISSSDGRFKVFGLVDRDLVPEVSGTDVLPDCVVATNAYDLTAEVSMAHPGSLGMAARSHAHRESRSISEQRGHDIEDAIVEVASAYAGVRVAVLRHRYPIRLDGFDFSKAIGTRFETPDAESFIAHLRVTKPTEFSWNDERIGHVRDSIAATVGSRLLCGGHDLAAVAFGLVTIAGLRQFSMKAFEASLRVHATCGLLSNLSCIVRLQELCLELVGISMFDCFESAA